MKMKIEIEGTEEECARFYQRIQRKEPQEVAKPSGEILVGEKDKTTEIPWKRILGTDGKAHIIERISGGAEIPSILDSMVDSAKAYGLKMKKDEIKKRAIDTMHKAVEKYKLSTKQNVSIRLPRESCKYIKWKKIFGTTANKWIEKKLVRTNDIDEVYEMALAIAKERTNVPIKQLKRKLKLIIHSVVGKNQKLRNELFSEVPEEGTLHEQMYAIYR